MDRIACDDCGRSFLTRNGAALMEVLVGPCPCGGRFVLAATEPVLDSSDPARPAAPA